MRRSPRGGRPPPGSTATRGATPRRRRAAPPGPGSEVLARVPRTRLTAETEDPNSRGRLRAINFVAFVRPIAGSARRAVSRSQASHPGASGSGSSGPVPIRVHRSQRGVQRLRVRVRDRRAALGGTCTDRNTRRDQIVRGEPVRLPRPFTGAGPGVEVRADVGVFAQVLAAVILRRSALAHGAAGHLSWCPGTTFLVPRGLRVCA